MALPPDPLDIKIRPGNGPLEGRFELSLTIGPCDDEAALALADAIIGLSEFNAVGGGAVGIAVVEDE